MKLLFLLSALLVFFNIHPVYSQNDIEDQEISGKNQEIKQALDSSHNSFFVSFLFGTGLLDNHDDSGWIDLPPMIGMVDLSVVFSHLKFLDIICGIQCGSFGVPNWLAVHGGAGSKELILLPVDRNFFLTAQAMLTGHIGIYFDGFVINFSSGNSLMLGMKGEVLIHLHILEDFCASISAGLGLYNNEDAWLYWLLSAKIGFRF